MTIKGSISCFTAAFLALTIVFALLPVLAESKRDYAPFNNFGSLWPNGRIFYKLDHDYSAAQKAMILRAMQDIQSKTCLQFVEARSDDANYVYFRKAEDAVGCLGGVGFDARPYQLVQLSNSCFNAIGSILKVLVHVAGLSVENNRPDRDLYVNINYKNVDVASKYDKRSTTDLIQAYFMQKYPFDYDSITNNHPYAFAINSKLPTISPKKQLPRGVVFGQRTHLSSIDILKLKYLYCEKNSPVNFLPKPGATTQQPLVTPPTPAKCGNCRDDCSAINPCCEGFYCFQAIAGQLCFQNDDEFCDSGKPASAAALTTKRKCKTCNERCSVDADCCEKAGMTCKNLGAPIGKVCYGETNAKCITSLDCCPGHCSGSANPDSDERFCSMPSSQN